MEHLALVEVTTSANEAPAQYGRVRISAAVPRARRAFVFVTFSTEIDGPSPVGSFCAESTDD